MINQQPKLQLKIIYFTKLLSGHIGQLLVELPASRMLEDTIPKLLSTLEGTLSLRRTEEKVVLLIDIKMDKLTVKPMVQIRFNSITTWTISIFLIPTKILLVLSTALREALTNLGLHPTLLPIQMLIMFLSMKMVNQLQ